MFPTTSTVNRLDGKFCVFIFLAGGMGRAWGRRTLPFSETEHTKLRSWGYISFMFPMYSFVCTGACEGSGEGAGLGTGARVSASEASGTPKPASGHTKTLLDRKGPFGP